MEKTKIGEKMRKVGHVFPLYRRISRSRHFPTHVSVSGVWQLFLFTAYVGINLSVGWPGPDVERNVVRERAWAHEIYRYTFACPRSRCVAATGAFNVKHVAKSGWLLAQSCVLLVSRNERRTRPIAKPTQMSTCFATSLISHAKRKRSIYRTLNSFSHLNLSMNSISYIRLCICTWWKKYDHATL